MYVSLPAILCQWQVEQDALAWIERPVRDSAHASVRDINNVNRVEHISAVWVQAHAIDRHLYPCSLVPSSLYVQLCYRHIWGSIYSPRRLFRNRVGKSRP